MASTKHKSLEKEFEERAVAILDEHPSRSQPLLTAVTKALLAAYRRGRREEKEANTRAQLEAVRDRPRHFGSPC